MPERHEPETSALSLNVKGIRLTEQGRCAEAIAVFDHAVDIAKHASFEGSAHPISGIYYNRAEAKRLAGDEDGAKADLLLALETDPDQVDCLNALGLLAYERDDFEEALRWYDKALAIDPSYAAAWNDTGVIRFRRGQYGEARRCFEKAVALDPESEEALYNLADTYDELGLQRERKAAAAALAALRIREGREGGEDGDA